MAASKMRLQLTNTYRLCQHLVLFQITPFDCYYSQSTNIGRCQSIISLTRHMANQSVESSSRSEFMIRIH